MAEIPWSRKQVKPHKVVIFKVRTNEIESLSTIKHFNKNESK